MADPNQIRINELARELEVKAKVLIDFLPEIGVTEKKTHSSSLDLDKAELARKHFNGLAAKEAAAEAEKQAKATAAKKPAARPAAAAPAPAVTAKPAAAAPATAAPSAPATAAKPAAPAIPRGASCGSACVNGCSECDGCSRSSPFCHSSGCTSSGARTCCRETRCCSRGWRNGSCSETRCCTGCAAARRSRRTAPTRSRQSRISTAPPAPAGAAGARPAGAPPSGQRYPVRPGAPPSGGAPRPGAPQSYRPSAAPGQSRPGGPPRPGGAPRPGGGPPGRFPSRPGSGGRARRASRSAGTRRTGSALVRPAVPEFRKPNRANLLYARKPPARGRPLIEKRYAEGERKLHPVRTRAGVGAGRSAQAEPVAPVQREPRASDRHRRNHGARTRGEARHPRERIAEDAARSRNLREYQSSA